MKTDRFDVWTSILIAFVTICSALTVWRANAASVQAGNADFNGLSATIRAQEARIANAVTAFEHMRAFTTYYRYDVLADKIDETESDAAAQEQSELWGLALGLQYYFFPSRYLDQDGNYDIERELDELWAESNSFNDLNPEPHFLQADDYRGKASLLTGSLSIFALSFLFLAVSQAIRNNFKFLFALAGAAALLGGICAVLVFEFGF